MVKCRSPTFSALPKPHSDPSPVTFPCRTYCCLLRPFVQIALRRTCNVIASVSLAKADHHSPATFHGFDARHRHRSDDCACLLWLLPTDSRQAETKFECGCRCKSRCLLRALTNREVSSLEFVDGDQMRIRGCRDASSAQHSLHVHRLHFHRLHVHRRYGPNNLERILYTGETRHSML